MRGAQHPTSANATRSEQTVQNDDKMTAEDVSGNSLTGLIFSSVRSSGFHRFHRFKLILIYESRLAFGQRMMPNSNPQVGPNTRSIQITANDCRVTLSAPLATGNRQSRVFPEFLLLMRRSPSCNDQNRTALSVSNTKQRGHIHQDATRYHFVFDHLNRSFTCIRRFHFDPLWYDSNTTPDRGHWNQAFTPSR